MPRNKGIPDFQKYEIENGSYGDIVYDKYRKVFYRFCTIGDDLGENPNLYLLSSYKTKGTIIILNDSLETMGEVVLPERRFNFSNYFIAKEGLYLSKNTPLSSDIDEDHLRFSLLELKVEN